MHWKCVRLGKSLFVVCLKAFHWNFTWKLIIFSQYFRRRKFNFMPNKSTGKKKQRTFSCFDGIFFVDYTVLFFSLSVSFGWFMDLGRKKTRITSKIMVFSKSIHMKYHWHLSFHEHSMFICSSVSPRGICTPKLKLERMFFVRDATSHKRVKVIKVTWTLFLLFSIETRKSITEHKAKLVHTNNSIFSISLLCSADSLARWLYFSLCVSVLCFFCLLSVSSVCDECRWERILSCVLNITDDNVISNAVLCHSRSRYTVSLSFSISTAQYTCCHNTYVQVKQDHRLTTIHSSILHTKLSSVSVSFSRSLFVRGKCSLYFHQTHSGCNGNLHCFCHNAMLVRYILFIIII